MKEEVCEGAGQMRRGRGCRKEEEAELDGGCDRQAEELPHELTLSQQVLGHEAVLAVSQHEGEEGEDEGVHDAHDGQDVGPAHGARPQGVLIRLLAAHALHLVAVPAIGVDHAAQDQTGTWGARERHGEGKGGGEREGEEQAMRRQVLYPTEGPEIGHLVHAHPGPNKALWTAIVTWNFPPTDCSF